MFHADYTEALIAKAIDLEPMTDRELRDFAQILIDDADAAKEFALLHRITADAAELPQTAPSAAFADRVMEAVAEAPAPSGARPASLPEPGRGWWAAVATVFAAVAAGWVMWSPRLSPSAWAEAAGIYSLAGLAKDALHSAEALLAAWGAASPLPAMAGWVAWLAICLPLLAVALNFVSLRPAKQRAPRS